MHSHEKLLSNNKTWAAERAAKDSQFFERLANQQAPDFLWIGCSDSRVPANQITGTDPGEIFVHRNIANLVVNTDINMLSVLQYAVEVLEVKHVIVCGHYGCGGIKASMKQHNYGTINHWLTHIRDVYRLHREELDAVTEFDDRANLLTEISVREQVFNLAKTSIIQKAWKKNKYPELHGWVYGLSNGLIKPVIDMDASTPIDPLYEYDNV